MKVNFRNILIASAVILAAAGCSKAPVKDGHETDEITFCVSVPETKAMFTPVTFAQEGNRLKIYDFNDEEKYFDDLIGPDVDGNTYGYSGVWPFENAPHAWTVDTHKFFGWLANDASSTPDDTSDDLTPNKIWGDDFSFDETTRILTIPETVMDQDAPQFDFLYSNIITRDMVNSPDYSPVNLEFKHLFTAVSLGASNGTETDVTIQEFKIENIINKRAATIDFSGNAPVVTYQDFDQNTFTWANSKPYVLGSEKSVSNIFDGSNTQKFMMLWPLKSDQLHHPVIEVDPGDDGNVDYEDYPKEYKMYIKYTFADDKMQMEKRMNFPKIDFEAGKKYHFDISFADKTIELKTIVKDWIHDAQTIDYANSAVTVHDTGVLKWDGTLSTLMESETGEKLVVIKNGQPAEATFTISTPLGGVWLISLSGDIEAFRVDPDNGEINASSARIRVIPLVEDPKREYKVKLKFAVRRPDGRIIAADELVQPEAAKRTVVLSPM